MVDSFSSMWHSHRMPSRKFCYFKIRIAKQFIQNQAAGHRLRPELIFRGEKPRARIYTLFVDVQ